MWAHHVPLETKRWGEIKTLTVRADGHEIDFDADGNFSSCFWQSDTDRPGLLRPGRFNHAAGGYVLIRFDLDGEPASVVHVEPPSGCYSIKGLSPVDLMDRAIGYLTVLRDKLRRIDALDSGEVQA